MFPLFDNITAPRGRCECLKLAQMAVLQKNAILRHRIGKIYAETKDPKRGSGKTRPPDWFAAKDLLDIFTSWQEFHRRPTGSKPPLSKPESALAR